MFQNQHNKKSKSNAILIQNFQNNKIIILVQTFKFGILYVYILFEFFCLIALFWKSKLQFIKYYHTVNTYELVLTCIRSEQENYSTVFIGYGSVININYQNNLSVSRGVRKWIGSRRVRCS